MNLKILVLVILVKIVTGHITIKVNVDENKNVTITHYGSETNIITDEDMEAFNMPSNEGVLEDAVKEHLGKRPVNVYVKSPTPWGDLYKKYKWEQVSKVLSIKSVKVKSLTKRPIVLLSEDFHNLSDGPTKVNTGISHSIENTLTTSWTKEKEITVSQEIEYEFNVGLGKMSGTTGFSYTSTWGVGEEKSKTETVGTSSSMEKELQPGQSVTAVLSASAGYLELEIVYTAHLRGNLALNYRRAYRGHHFWGPLISDVMESGGLKNEITFKENVVFGFHVDASIKVYDKKTGLPL
ncbi:spherulin-2A-like [Trichoplusia ni]|uniref:Spherulin-2A-like n=1 Tax=Trichoplusia ni TaxID=7111 RepID=A0A7E5WUB7_TRINI|nr:spherulin-2A-like [Trichoplusia ni]